MTPASGGDPSFTSRLDAAVEKFLELRRANRPEGIDQFVERYPDLASDLRDLLPALEGLESLKGPTPDAEPPVRTVSLDRLGSYRIVRELGHGGMGIVYEAEDTILGRRVALKILPRHARLDPRLVERFRREAQAAARLHHTNIVPIFGFHEEDAARFYTMQCIDGQSVDRVIRNLRELEGSAHDGPFLPTCGEGAQSEGSLREEWSGGTRAYHAGRFLDIATIGIQAAEALDYAHRHGVLHRDIKPSNLIIDEIGDIWITDFGLAKAEGVDGLTYTGELVGTCRYMAPEAFEGRSLPQSDVYGLGVTLYELATLTPAFDDTIRTRLVQRIVSEPPTRPRRLDRRIPRDLETIILKAVQKDPRDRYATAGSFAEDLRRFRAGTAPVARNPGPTQRSVRWVQRNPAATAATLTIAALLVITAIALAQTRASLREANLNTARLARSTREVGRRSVAIAALTSAAAIRPGLDLRNEAAAALNLFDLAPGRRIEFGHAPHSARFDADLTRTAFVDPKTKEAVVVSLKEGQELLRDSDFHEVDRVFLSGDGSILAAASYSRLRAWQIEGADGQSELVLDRRVPSINFAIISLAAGSRLSYCSKSQLVVISLTGNAKGTEERYDLKSMVPFGEGTPHSHLSPDGDRSAVVYHRTSVVALVDLATRSVRRLDHGGPVFHAIWHPCRPVLLTSQFHGQGSRVVLWDATEGTQLRSVDDKRIVIDRPWPHPTADVLCGAGWGHVFRIWDQRTGRQILEGKGRPVRFSVDGQRFALWRSDHVQLGNVSRSTVHCVLLDPERTQAVRASAFHPSLPIIACGYDGIGFWDLQYGRLLASVRGSMTRCLRFLNNGSELLAVGDEGVSIRPLTSRVEEDTVELVIGPPRIVSGMRLKHACVSSDDRTVYATEAQTTRRRILAIDLRTGDTLNEWGPFDSIDHLSVSPCGRWLAGGLFGHSRRALRIIDLERESVEVLDFGANPNPVFGPKGSRLVVGAREGYSLVEMGSWRLVKHIPVEDGSMGCLSPDGLILAGRRGRNQITLFSSESGDELVTLSPDDSVESFRPVFRNDGRYLSAGSRLWNIGALRTSLDTMGLDWMEGRPGPPGRVGQDHVTVRVRFSESDR